MHRSICSLAVVHIANAVYCVNRSLRPTNSKYAPAVRDIERDAYVICSIRERDMFALRTFRIWAQMPQKNQKPRSFDRGFSGAATQIRTGDLILTKDVLYQLSHSSISQEYFLVTQTIIAKIRCFVNTFVKFIFGFLQKSHRST